MQITVYRGARATHTSITRLDVLSYSNVYSLTHIDIQLTLSVLYFNTYKIQNLSGNIILLYYNINFDTL